MTKTNFRIFALAVTFAIIFTVASPINLTAQIFGIPGLGQPKRKDFNKLPDAKEFQQPTNGEYKANPTFFVARSDDERCNAIDLWLSSVRFEASQSSSYKNARYYWKDGVLDMDKVNSAQITKFATPAFRNIFGKGLPELSEKEVKQVSKSLNKCSHQRWAFYYLEQPFTYPVQLQGWMTQFDKMEETANREKIAAQKRQYRERYQKEARETGYNVAELLKETDSYSLHAAFLNDGYTDWCSPTEKQAIVGVIFKIGENSPVKNDEAYWQSFEQEMLPVIRSSCTGAEKIYVLNYVKGFYISYNQNQIDEKVNRSYPSDVHSIGEFTANSQPKYSWIKGDKLSNLIVGYSQRTQSRIIFKNSTDNVNNTGQTATISNLKQIFKINREKLAAEEKIRQEKAAAVERERQKQIEAASEERKRRLALESKNGLEPNSEELAIATLRLAFAFVGCSNIIFNEVCQGNFGMSYKVIDAKKIRCKPVTRGKDYQCVYTIKVEIRGHPLLAPAQEFDINSATFKAGFTKSANGWSLYKLTAEQQNAL